MLTILQTHWIIRLTEPGDFNHSPWKLGYDPSSVQAKVSIISESNGYRWHLDANGEILSDMHGLEDLYLRYA